MKKLKVSIALNLLNIILETTGFIVRFILYGTKDLFKYYTRNSSLFLLIATSIMFIFELLYYYKGKEISKWVYTLKYTAIGLTTLTFFTVLFVLGPQMSTYMGLAGAYGFLLLYGDCLFQHFLCPVVGFISFVFFENERKLTIKDSLIAMIPTIVYAIIILILVGVNLITPPYFFFDIHNQPIYMDLLWFSLLLGIIYGFYLLIKFVNNKRIEE